MPFIVPDKVREPLHVIVPLHNPWRHKSRWKHIERAIKHFMDSGAVVTLVEVGFNRRELAFADSGIDRLASNMGPLGTDHGLRHSYIGLHSTSEIWLKENSINVAVQRLPYNWQQIAWIDGDVHFVRPNWVGECIHKLQHFSFLQMFSQAFDLSPDYEELPAGYPHSSGVSFMQAYVSGTLNLRGGNILNDIRKVERDLRRLVKDVKQLEQDLSYPGHVWPGLAWACTRAAFDAVGGLFDVAVWGGGDYDMAHALLEQASSKIHPDMHEGYLRLLLEWENRCQRHIRKNVGVMTGAIYHHWHGRKSDRHYESKRKLMRMVKFDPIKFLKRDSQGIWQLHDDGSDQFIHFRDMMRKIAAARDEDNNDTRLDLQE